MTYTQEELSSVWHKLTDGIEHGVHDEIDVAELVCSQNLVHLMAKTVTNLDVEQTIAFSASVGAVQPYRDNDEDCDTTIGSFTRTRPSTEAPWGASQDSENL